jgi:hypothetical protein
MATMRMVTLGWTVTVFLGALAHTQDTSRVPDIDVDVSAVDNSARRDIDERQPQPSQGPRTSKSYSRWSLQPTSAAPGSQPVAPAKPGIQPSASAAWSYRAPDSRTALPSPLHKMDEQQTSFEGMMGGRQQNGLTGSRLSNAYIPSSSLSSSPGQVSAPSSEKPFGLTAVSPFPGFSSYPRRSKTRNSRSQSTARSRSSGDSVTSSATK